MRTPAADYSLRRTQRVAATDPTKVKGCNYCFTLHNYTEEDKDTLKALDLKYLLWGEEKCPTTGREHLQGYLVLKKEKTHSACKKFIGIPTIHVEISRHGIEVNYKYCTKTRTVDTEPNEVVYEQGVKPMSQADKGDAEKTRWSDARAGAISGNFGENITTYILELDPPIITMCPCTVQCPCDFGNWCFECSLYCLSANCM